MSARDDVLDSLITVYREFAGDEDMLRNPKKYAQEDLEELVNEVTADMRMAMGKLLAELLETEHQLRLAQLELIKANVMRELAESDVAGVKATLKELRADNENKDVMYTASQAMVDDLIIERDGYKAALDNIDSITKQYQGAGVSRTIQVILKRVGL